MFDDFDHMGDAADVAGVFQRKKTIAQQQELIAAQNAAQEELQQINERQAQEDALPDCPYCGGKIKTGFELCRNCSRELAWVDAKDLYDLGIVDYPLLPCKPEHAEALTNAVQSTIAFYGSELQKNVIKSCTCCHGTFGANDPKQMMCPECINKRVRKLESQCKISSFWICVIGTILFTTTAFLGLNESIWWVFSGLIAFSTFLMILVGRSDHEEKVIELTHVLTEEPCTQSASDAKRKTAPYFQQQCSIALSRNPSTHRRTEGSDSHSQYERPSHHNEDGSCDVSVDDITGIDLTNLEINREAQAPSPDGTKVVRILIQCGSCGSELAVSATDSGNTTKCSNCGIDFIIP